MPDPDTQELHSQTDRRIQVMEILGAQRNRLSSASRAVSPRIRARLQWLEQNLDGLDQGLRQTLHRCAMCREQDDLLRSAPGARAQFSVAPLSDLPGLGTPGRRQIAALVGMASLNRTAKS